MTGKPSSQAILSASSMEAAIPERGVAIPSPAMVFLKSSRSSPLSMASRFTPMTLTPYCFKIPALWRVWAMLSPV